jgi:hypothetical protein
MSAFQLIASAIGPRTAAPQLVAQPATADPLAQLLEERGRLEAERRRLAAVDATRLDADAKVAELDVEQRVIDEAKRRAWSAWVQTPDRDKPLPLTERRVAVAHRRVLSSLNASRAIAPRLEALSAKLRLIEDRLFAARLENVMADVRTVHGQVCDSAAKLSDAAARLYRFDRTLTTLHTASDATPVHRQAARVQFDSLKQPGFAVSPAAIDSHAGEWRRQIIS